VELELNPLCVKIFKHQTIQRQPNVPTIVGGYSAAAMQAGVSTEEFQDHFPDIRINFPLPHFREK
jgi:hypothetical protein